MGRVEETPVRRSGPGPRWMRAAGGAAALALAGLAPAGQLLGQDPVRIDTAGWEVAGDGRIGRWEGLDAILLRQGEAVHERLTLADGTLEFDLLVPEGRTFIGLELRLGPDGTYEDLYLRPHKSGLPDAVQYNPAFLGLGQWQLWHGPGSTGFADFEPGEWLRVRAELAGDRAALYLDGADEPVLVTPPLATGRTEGRIGFWANRPGAGPDDPWTAVITNVRVGSGRPAIPAPPPADADAPPGTLMQWELSRPWGADGSAADLAELPDEVMSGEWTDATAEPGGLVALQRWLGRPSEGVPTVLARARLDSDEARLARLELGFSDDATVFLNGRPVAGGRNGYSYNFPRRDGLLTPDQMTVHLPLRAGRNELVVRVSDGFGGWGLRGRIVDGPER